MIGPICRYPLLQFLLIGGLAFLWLGMEEPKPSLVISSEQQRQARQLMLQQSATDALTEQQNQRLIKQLVEESLLVEFALGAGGQHTTAIRKRLIQLAYFLELVDGDASKEQALRQATSLGLHRDDAVIRQTLANLSEILLQQDSEPCCTEAEIHQYYLTNASTFATENLWNFQHLFFKSKDQSSKNRALAALKHLRSGAKPIEQSDVFFGGHEFSAISGGGINKLLGSEFPLPLKTGSGAWQGPFQSAYGWHLVRSTLHTPSQVAPLREVAESIRWKLIVERRQEALKSNLALLEKSFDIIIEDAG